MTKEIMDKAAERMAGAEQQLLSNFASVRTGRANAMILDRVKADYYGVPTPINQMPIRSLSSRGTSLRSAASTMLSRRPTWALCPTTTVR